MAGFAIFALLAVAACAHGFELDNLYSIEHFLPQLKEMQLPADFEERLPFLPAIIGGKNTTRGEHPHHAILIMSFPEGQGLCGASIIAKKYLLTAAHCVHGIENKPENVSAFVGVLHLTELRSVNRLVGKRIHVHEGFTGKPEDSFCHDIAVIELTEAINYTAHVKRIKINTVATPEKGTKCQNIGFGRIDGLKQNISLTLKSTEIKIASHDRCKFFNRALNLTDGQLCLHAFTTSPCQGDSGGALTCEIDGTRYQSGLVSFGLIPTCVPFPNVQTNVFKYADWVHAKSNCNQEE